MLDFTKTTLDALVIHRVGNRIRKEGVVKGLVKEYVLNLAEAFAYEQYQKSCETGVVPLG
jgi:hypothetical protein